MEETPAPPADAAGNPDGVLAVVVLGIVGAVYATAVGIRDLTPAGTIEDATLVVAGLVTLVALLGLWRHRLWGYAGTVLVAAVTGFLFVRSGDPLAAATAVGVLTYLLLLHERYLADRVVTADG